MAGTLPREKQTTVKESENREVEGTADFRGKVRHACREMRSQQERDRGQVHSKCGLERTKMFTFGTSNS